MEVVKIILLLVALAPVCVQGKSVPADPTHMTTTKTMLPTNTKENAVSKHKNVRPTSVSKIIQTLVDQKSSNQEKKKLTDQTTKRETPVTTTKASVTRLPDVSTTSTPPCNSMSLISGKMKLKDNKALAKNEKEEILKYLANCAFLYDKDRLPFQDSRAKSANDSGTTNNFFNFGPALFSVSKPYLRAQDEQRNSPKNFFGVDPAELKNILATEMIDGYRSSFTPPFLKGWGPNNIEYKTQEVINLLHAIYSELSFLSSEPYDYHDYHGHRDASDYIWDHSDPFRYDASIEPWEHGDPSGGHIDEQFGKGPVHPGQRRGRKFWNERATWLDGKSLGSRQRKTWSRDTAKPQEEHGYPQANIHPHGEKEFPSDKIAPQKETEWPHYKTFSREETEWPHDGGMSQDDKTSKTVDNFSPESSKEDQHNDETPTQKEDKAWAAPLVEQWWPSKAKWFSGFGRDKRTREYPWYDFEGQHENDEMEVKHSNDEHREPFYPFEEDEAFPEPYHMAEDINERSMAKPEDIENSALFKKPKRKYKDRTEEDETMENRRRKKLEFWVKRRQKLQ